jgi:tight adherence protein B
VSGGPVVLLLALTLLFAGVAVLAAVVLGIARSGVDAPGGMRRRLSIYTLTGRGHQGSAEDGGGGRGGGGLSSAARAQPNLAIGNSAMARGAVDLADRMVRRRGLERTLAERLEGAALPIRTGEWLVLHVGVAVLLALLLLLLTGGGLPGLLLGLVVGLAAPWLFLVVRAGRRESAFLAQLPDTLQMLAGSLSAGYSLPQAIDTVVREGQPPISAEFNRALVESRLGMPVEDALDGIAERLSSEDFSWVVMAIKIQSEVGGNLAELLVTVADTLRERERLRRQVQVLSAEGRLSGWILGCLPVAFAGYLMLTQPSYLQQLTTPLGLVLVVIAVVLLAAGGLWTAKVIKVEV